MCLLTDRPGLAPLGVLTLDAPAANVGYGWAKGVLLL